MHDVRERRFVLDCQNFTALEETESRIFFALLLPAVHVLSKGIVVLDRSEIVG